METTENPTPEQTKLCSRCRQEKPLSEFSLSAKSKDGHQYHCKACHAEMNRQRHVERIASKGLNPALAGFQPRHLIEELRARGYKGKLYYTHEITL